MAETLVKGRDVDLSDGTPRRVVINKTDVDSNPALDVNCYGGSGAAIDIQNLGTGPDIKGTNGIWSISKTGVASLIIRELPPVGSIIPFYDFNGTLTFEPEYWTYCDGSSKLIAGVVRTIPDVSGRYLVGFGSDGDKNIGTSLWSTAPVGNSFHRINIQHYHLYSRDFSVSINHAHSHNFSIPAHYHGKGNLSISSSGDHSHLTRIGKVKIGEDDWAWGYSDWMDRGEGAHYVNLSTVGSSFHSHPNQNIIGNVGATGGVPGDSAFSLSGNIQSTSGLTASLSGSSYNTGNALSSSTSIQPKSVCVRFIMRIK